MKTSLGGFLDVNSQKSFSVENGNFFITCPYSGYQNSSKAKIMIREERCSHGPIQLIFTLQKSYLVLLLKLK